jgi:hypothetical protein
MTNHSIATVFLSGPLDEVQRAVAHTGYGAVNAPIRSPPRRARAAR